MQGPNDDNYNNSDYNHDLAITTIITTPTTMATTIIYRYYSWDHFILCRMMGMYLAIYQ